MILVPLPLSPIEIELGKHPLYYYSGDKSISSDKYDYVSSFDKNINRALLPYSIKDQNILIDNEATVTTIKDGRLEIDLTPRSDISRSKFLNKVRRFLIQDIIRNGIPGHFSNIITYKFDNEIFEFNVHDLKCLELFRFPKIADQTRKDFVTHIAGNLSAQMCILPAMKNGEFVLFEAQYRSATDILQLYFDYHLKYADQQNLLIQFIMDFEFGENNNLSTL